MWTATHYYALPPETPLETLPIPDLCALDLVGPANNGTTLINARWWGAAPTPWAAFQLPPPQFPQREFA